MGNVLEGIRVADFTAVMAGSSGTMFLGDLGADVIKVENVAGGDYSRDALPYLFQAVNRNKRSLALDLTTAAGVEVARRLVATSDVMVQGFRPGALDRKGLGAAELRAQHPRLIYTSLSGFGSTGPGHDRRGIDQLVQAETGMANVMGAVNQRLGLVDAAAGIVIGQAVLAALFKREREGAGEHIEISLYDTALWLQMLPIAEYSVTRVPPLQPQEYELRTPTMGMFEVADGWIFMAIITQDTWLKLCDLIGEGGLVDDPRFTDRHLRRANGAALKEILVKAMLRQDRSTLIEAAEREGLMITSVKDYDDVFADPQAAANGSFQVVPSWDGTEVTHVRAPYRFRADTTTPAPQYRRSPKLGEHSIEVLGELGYTPTDIRRLTDEVAIAAG